ncbi:MAG: late competence development ComFB family protein [bacterium]
MQYVNFDSVKNYYESLVFQHICTNYAAEPEFQQPGALEDIACLALNQLPSRYVRFAIDASFYLSADEQEDMHEAVRKAVDKAADFVRSHPKTAAR